MITLSSIWLHQSPIMPSMISPTKSKRIWKKIGPIKFTKWGHNQLLIKYRNVEQKKKPRRRDYHFPKRTLPPNLAGPFRRTFSSCQNRTHSREHWMLTWARNQRFKIKIITPSMSSPKELKHRNPSTPYIELIWLKQISYHHWAKWINSLKVPRWGTMLEDVPEQVWIIMQLNQQEKFNICIKHRLGWSLIPQMLLHSMTKRTHSTLENRRKCWISRFPRDRLSVMINLLSVWPIHQAISCPAERKSSLPTQEMVPNLSALKARS